MKLFCVFVGILVVGCASSKINYSKEYRRIWKEMIQSDAWNAMGDSTATSLLSKKNKSLDKIENKEDLEAAFYAYEAKEEGLVLDSLVDYSSYNPFLKKYQSLVSRAYFKIITEAENADNRLQKEYNVLEAQNKDVFVEKNRAYKKKADLITKRFLAHRNMLEGLKSWQIFTEHKSGDLSYFKAENLVVVYHMYLLKKKDDQIVNYLVYKLADLYHFEE